MKIQHYSYTRGLKIDYGNFSYPDNIVKTSVDKIRNMALSILGDGIPRDMSIPKWIFYKEKEFIIWGVCCENRLLNQNKYVDHRNRPIRGLFAIIITEYDDSEVKLPFDIEYFKQLYALEVEPYWEQYEQHKNKTTGFITGNFKYIYACANISAKLLNTDIFKCKSLWNANQEEVLSAALTLDNISLLIDNDNIEQAINENGSFMNCLSIKVPIGEYGVKQKCQQCGKFVSAFADGRICTECKEKESLRIINIKKEEEMDRKLKDDLDISNRKIKDLESIIESDKNSIKKKGLIIKILLGVIFVLLLALSYAYRDIFSLNISGKNKDHSIEQCQKKSTNDTSHKYFSTDKTIVMVDGNKHVEDINFKTNIHVDSFKIKCDRDWITANLKSNNLIQLIIAPNDKVGKRIGEIVILQGKEKCGSIEIQQSNKCE